MNSKSGTRKRGRRVEDAKLEKYSKILQGVATIALVAVVAIDAYAPNFEVQWYVPWAIAGGALGLRPEQIVSLIKLFWSRK